MTDETAIEILRFKKEMAAYEDEEAFDMAIYALEKQIQKKPTCQYKRCGFVVEGCCPCCDKSVLPEHQCCHSCGQYLDWTEV